MRNPAAVGQAPASSAAPAPLLTWLRGVSPAYRWDWSHLAHIRRHLDAVTAGTVTRLILQVPPRHGKTELATIRYPVYRLAQRGDMRVMVGAYNQTLANRFSRRARRVAALAGVALSRERTAAEEWETEAGGTFRAVGVGGGVTGQGADLIVIDDPVKSREEAESTAYRDRVWDWYTNDIFTRREPGAALVIIMTRWHQDDLVGRILASDDAAEWTVVTLPALAEPGDALGRAEGAALCPERYDERALAEIRKVLGRDFTALYQQRPQPREGGLFKFHWLPLVDEVPRIAQRVRWWDKAATESGGNYSAGVLMAEADGVYYVEDVSRGQWSVGERDRIIRATAERDRERFGNVITWGPQDPGQAGKADAQAFARLLAGFDVHSEPESGAKEVRAAPLAAQAEAGNVRVRRGPWASAFIDELCAFPGGRFDDQVDGAANAFNKLANGAGGSFVMRYR